jgi:hypothetical protein
MSAEFFCFVFGWPKLWAQRAFERGAESAATPASRTAPTADTVARPRTCTCIFWGAAGPNGRARLEEGLSALA